MGSIGGGEEVKESKGERMGRTEKKMGSIGRRGSELLENRKTAKVKSSEERKRRVSGEGRRSWLT